MRYFIELSYKGTAYSGWQRQLNAIGIQQLVEEALQRLLNHETPIVGCGRTDAGVHAAHYTAHFETDNESVTEQHFTYHLNGLLPLDISIHKIYASELHARFDARYREYKYYIALRRTPFANELSWLRTMPLDIDKMRLGAEVFKTYTDFASMCKVGSENKTTECEIYCVNWEVSENMLIFTIGANRFLRGMVRAIVGTLVDVGRGRFDVEHIHTIMQSQNRCAAGASAPARGLFLTDIKY